MVLYGAGCAVTSLCSLETEDEVACYLDRWQRVTVAVPVYSESFVEQERRNFQGWVVNPQQPAQRQR